MEGMVSGIAQGLIAKGFGKGGGDGSGGTAALIGDRASFYSATSGATSSASGTTTPALSTIQEPATATIETQTEPQPDPTQDALEERLRRLLEPQVPAPPVPTETIQTDPDRAIAETQTDQSTYLGRAARGGGNILGVLPAEKRGVQQNREVALNELQKKNACNRKTCFLLIPPLALAIHQTIPQTTNRHRHQQFVLHKQGVILH